MAKNNIPNNTGLLTDLANNMHSGLNALGTTLGITQITPTQFQAALNDFMACEASFLAFRSEQNTASTAWITAMDTLTGWLKVTRDVLAGRFGNQWSPQWAQAGFANSSTAVPRLAGERLQLTAMLISFFTAHPSYEVASMQVTAARATTLRNAALAAQDALTEVEVNKDTQWDTRAASRDGLVGLMRGLIKILGATIGKLDPQWGAFGLNMPGADTTPGQPVNVTVGLDFSGKISVQCDAVPLAQRYRWRMRIVGMQTAYELVGRSTAPSVLIAPIAPGAVGEIIVQAVNGGSQGVASEPVLFTMPLAVESAPEVGPKKGGQYGFAAESPEPKKGPRNGNGHTVAARH